MKGSHPPSLLSLVIDSSLGSLSYLPKVGSLADRDVKELESEISSILNALIFPIY
jgi:hypothetical protein